MRIISIFSLVLAILAKVSAFDPATGLSPTYATRATEPAACFMDADGKIWMGQYDGAGIIEFNSETNALENEVNGYYLGDLGMRDMTVVGNTIWAAGGSAFVQYNIATQSTEVMTLLPSQNTFSVVADQNEVAVATGNGLAKIKAADPSDQTVFWQGESFAKVLRANDGSLWCLDNGNKFIGHVQGRDLTVYDAQGEPGSAWDIAADQQSGDVWASAREGLWRFSGTSWTMPHDYGYSSADHKWDKPRIISEMIVDGFGVLWGFALKEGANQTVSFYLCRYDIGKGEMETFDLAIHFSWIRTLGSTSTNVYASLGLDKDGRLLIAGNEKVAYVTDNTSPVRMPIRMVHRHPAIQMFSNGFILSKPAQVSLSVHTANGRLISQVSGDYQAGTWNFPSFFSSAANANFVRLSVDGNEAAAKTLVLR